MIVPAYWAEGRVHEKRDGKQVTIRRFGWSDESQAAAQAHADDRAREAFAAFKATPAEILHTINNFFYTQKGFLRSRGLKGEPLTLQQVMRGRDAELYALHYTSLKRPEYLGEKQESHALILLHAPNSTRPTGRDQTWLFIVDGADLAGREFLLHRIVSGFR